MPRRQFLPAPLRTPASPSRNDVATMTSAVDKSPIVRLQSCVSVRRACPGRGEGVDAPERAAATGRAHNTWSCGAAECIQWKQRCDYNPAQQTRHYSLPFSPSRIFLASSRPVRRRILPLGV